ncbi:Mur ligase family protein [Candidatus Omnitrophota bacterium]
MNILGKKFCVLGLGITGYETAKFLNKHGFSVFVSEQSINPNIEQFALKLKSKGVSCELGGHRFSRIKNADIIVISPGISPRTPLVRNLQELKKKIISEVELASWFCKGKIIGITGTNGKTTVTTLLGRVIQKAGYKGKTCGNIGKPFISIVDTLDAHSYAIVELSSFQLYYSQRFRSHIGVVLNIAPDHFDWHTGMPEYARSKCKLFRNQKPIDYAVINYHDRELIEKYTGNIRSQTIYFSRNVKMVDNPNYDCIKKVASLIKIPARIVNKTLCDFKGLEHRMEIAGIKGGVSYVNDSKSTSPHSLAWALRLCKKKVILICGGKNKGVSFVPLQANVKKKVKALIAMGEAQEEIEQAFASCVSTTRTQSLKEALLAAKSKAQQGDVVLFSPACASFDMFKNYKERGKKFKELVARV